MNSSRPTQAASVQAVFVTTHWSVVLSARDKNSAGSDQALEELCRTYWYPLYAYVRRLGHSPADAEDLTQEFFSRLLRKDYLRLVTPERGRFRTFLLVALKRFLANEWDRLRAQKRGGGQRLASLDQAAEERYKIEPTDGLTPEKIYERRWAMTLLEQVLARLEQEFVAARKGEEFECLKACLTRDRDRIPYAEAAARLQISQGAARIAVHRLRKRFRELFRQEIAQTVAGPEEIDEEVGHLLAVLGE
jgi:RNA polymerase sigma-70 factor (ECF subfamily)